MSEYSEYVNPFVALKKQGKKEWELIEDSELHCQSCGMISTTGKMSSEGWVVWECPKGHENRARA